VGRNQYGWFGFHATSNFGTQTVSSSEGINKQKDPKEKKVNNGVNSGEVLSLGKGEGLSNGQNGEETDVEVNGGGFHSFCGNDVYQECLAHGINEVDNV
jgi:hypothetical protein